MAKKWYFCSWCIETVKSVKKPTKQLQTKPSRRRNTITILWVGLFVMALNDEVLKQWHVEWPINLCHFLWGSAINSYSSSVSHLRWPKDLFVPFSISQSRGSQVNVWSLGGSKPYLIAFWDVYHPSLVMHLPSYFKDTGWGTCRWGGRFEQPQEANPGVERRVFQVPDLEFRGLTGLT